MEVIYERDPDIGNGYQAYRGRVQIPNDVREFKGMHFDALLRLLHDKMPAEDTAIAFIRTDKPGLQPYMLEQDLVDLIKTDVEKAIERMSVPDIRIVVGRNPKPPATLRSGSETLAASFGERLMCRMRSGRSWMIECPGCGRWCPIHVAPVEYAGASTEVQVHRCHDCGIQLGFDVHDQEWVLIPVVDLLATNLEKFFLPREWNNYQPWVSREKLESLYNEFMKSKEQFNE